MQVCGGTALALDVLVDALDDLRREAGCGRGDLGGGALVERIEAEVELVERDGEVELLLALLERVRVCRGRPLADTAGTPMCSESW